MEATQQKAALHCPQPQAIITASPFTKIRKYFLHHTISPTFSATLQKILHSHHEHSTTTLPLSANGASSASEMHDYGSLYPHTMMLLLLQYNNPNIAYLISLNVLKNISKISSYFGDISYICNAMHILRGRHIELSRSVLLILRMKT